MTTSFLHLLFSLVLLVRTVLSKPLPVDPDTIPEGGIVDPLAGPEEGSSGKSTGSINLSEPALIAICVVVAIVVVIGGIRQPVPALFSGSCR